MRERVGRLSGGEIDAAFGRELAPPELGRVIVAAVRVGPKPVAILVADCEDERMQKRAFAPMVEAVDKMAAALFVLILRARTGLSEQ